MSLKYTCVGLPSQSLPYNSIMFPSGPWPLGCLLLTLFGVSLRIPKAKPGAHWFSIPSPPLSGQAISLGLALLGYTEHAQSTPSPPHFPLLTASPRCPERSWQWDGTCSDPGSRCPCPHAERLLYLPRHTAPRATPQGDLSPYHSPECFGPCTPRSQEEWRRPGEGESRGVQANQAWSVVGLPGSLCGATANRIRMRASLSPRRESHLQILESKI